MRAAIYLRNSDPRQAATDTDRSQLAAAEAAAERLGAKVVAVYNDAGKSAKTGKLAKRGAFARLVTDARAGKFDAVIVANVDRLTRTESFAELGAICGPLQDSGVRVITADGQVFDLNSPNGQLMVMFEAWRSARENAARSERTTRGRARVAREGRPSSAPPWWLSFDREANQWGLIEDRAELVRTWIARIAEGESTGTLAVEAQAAGIPRPRGAGNWERSRIYDLVTSLAAKGEWRTSGVAVTVPAIVDPELWQQAQDALTAGKLRGLRRTKHVYLLEGIAICVRCGAQIGIHDPRSKGVPSPYYVCLARRRRAGTGPRCDLPLRRVSAVDGALWESLSAWLARPELVEEALAQRDHAARHDQDWAADLRGYERRLARLDAVQAALLERFGRGLIGQAALDAELGRQAKERRLLERQIATARTGIARGAEERRGIAAARVAVEALRECLGEEEPSERQEAVRLLLPAGARALLTETGAEFPASVPGAGEIAETIRVVA